MHEILYSELKRLGFTEDEAKYYAEKIDKSHDDILAGIVRLADHRIFDKNDVKEYLDALIKKIEG